MVSFWYFGLTQHRMQDLGMPASDDDALIRRCFLRRAISLSCCSIIFNQNIYFLLVGFITSFAFSSLNSRFADVQGGPDNDTTF